jgi:ubiquinone/menaquinone biosynthesis C-methylase UbiE
MDTRQSYNAWASQYDSQTNLTRDLEARSLREILKDISFDSCLEIGCGTGKNTSWLIEKAKQVTAVDLSDEMLAKAKSKIGEEKVQFIQADITQDWKFIHQEFDLVTYSLVLEHIRDLDSAFEKMASAIRPGGYVYIGELHPFKQYSGSKARFETEAGLHIVDCYLHHISDFTQSMKRYGFIPLDIREYFDNDKRDEVPRILAMLFKGIAD